MTTRGHALARWALWVVLPLALGVLSYLALRGTDIRLFSWTHALGLDAAVSAMRAWAAPLRARVPSWLAGSGPDAAWAFSFGAAVGLVWRGRSGPAAWAWRVGCGVVAACVELGQAARLIPGVFDAFDLVAMVGGYALGCALVTRRAAR